MTHVKHARSAREAEWEVAGLSWLRAAGGVPVVDVLRHDARTITMARLRSVPATPAAAEDLGRLLHVTHSAGAPAFGAGPDGWAGDGYIGLAPLRLGAWDSWGACYAEARVLPYVRTAVDSGELSAADARVFEQLAVRLVDGDFDDVRPPQRIHGDLWSGNVIWTASGCVLIDPAAHGGRGETDLAMLALFGVPHLRRIEDAYAEAAQLTSGWRAFTPLHQVHPLLVHTVLFGGGYAHQAVAAATAALRL